MANTRLIGSYNEVATGATAQELIGPDESRRGLLFPSFSGISYTVWPGTNPNEVGIAVPPATAALRLMYSEIGDLICQPWMVNTFGANNVKFLEIREVVIDDSPSTQDKLEDALCRLIQLLSRTDGPPDWPTRRKKCRSRSTH